MTAANSQPNSTPLDIVLSRLSGARPSGDGYIASCPTSRHSRGDKRPGLKIDAKPDGTVLIFCHGGCDVEQVVSALGLEMGNLFPPRERRNGQGGGGVSNPAVETATAQPLAADGCTLAAYAAAKKIPEAVLRSYRLSDIQLLGAPALRIPYVDPDLTEAAVRFRISLKGDDRFRWRRGAKPTLYGLWRLRAAVELGFVILVEGESDCHTLWHHLYPAVGLPGASSWKEGRDASHFERIETVFVIREPDTGGESVERWLASSQIRDKVKLVSLGEFKDPSGLYLDDPERFPERFQEALETGLAWTDLQAAEAEDRQRSAWAFCARLAHESAILDRFAELLPRMGVVGEKRTSKLLFLMVVSRLLPRPSSAVVKGPSSAGKSFLVEKILTFFPASAYYALTAMSERALAYSEEPLSHRVLVIFEKAGLAGDFAAYLVRSLLSEGRIRYETVEKTKDGLVARVIEREGPTSLLMTTTDIKIHHENETRVLSPVVTDTRDQTKEIMRRQAADQESEPPDLAPWHALQEWLAGGPTEVAIPFAGALAELVPPVAVRLRRDFPSVLTLLRTHALLHRASREVDERGRIVATFDDYEVVRDLVADLVADGVEAAVSTTVRETVEVVKKLAKGDPSETQVAAIAKALKLDKATALRRVRAAIDRGYLRNLEDRKGRPARITLGDPMPDDMPILPTVEALRDGLQGCSPHGGDVTPPSPQDGYIEEEV